MRLLSLGLTLAATLACGPGEPPSGSVATGDEPAPPADDGGAPPADGTPGPADTPSGQGGACPASVTLRVIDGASGGPVRDVVVTGLDVRCEEGEDATVCTASPGPGQYDVEITAPGHAAAHVAIGLQSAASGPGADCSQTIDTTLTLPPVG